MNNFSLWNLLPCMAMVVYTTYQPVPEMASGEELYKEHCQSCHMKSGKGFFRMYPPLTDTAWVGNDERIVGNIIEGLKGEISVHGKTYNNEMPPMDYLSDEEIAAIVNYVRQEFAEMEAMINSERVKELREKME